MPTLLAVDGNSLFHRAYHAYLPRDANTAPSGNWGVTGFLSMLTGVIERVKPESLVIGFDDYDSSLRRAGYPEYKAGRGARDAELHNQQLTTIKVLRDMGLNVFIPTGLEADDVVASASVLAFNSDYSCVIATSDRDSFSLISANTHVLRLMNGGISEAVLMTPARMLEKVGVDGWQYLDYAALRGDKSDNIPGVSGFGEKTASKLLNALGSMDAAYFDIDNNEAEQVTAAIGRGMTAKISSPEAREAFKLSRDLMTLHDELELGDILSPIKVNNLRDGMQSNGITGHNRLIAALGGSINERPARPELTPVDEPVIMDVPVVPTNLVPVSNVTSEMPAVGRVNDVVAFSIPNARPVRSLLTR